MKARLILLSLLLTNHFGIAQPIAKVIDYTPAPGQWTNTDEWGSRAKAETVFQKQEGGISLGGYGGSITLALNSPIKNNPNNPYGIDFTLLGNTAGDASEPAVVMVMKDENGNGKADDTWYELAGSDYYFTSTIKNYSITYTNPNSPVAANIPWADNQQNQGFIYANAFHKQPYYPQPTLFPNISQQCYTLSGTKIKASVDRTNPYFIRSYTRAFGYADNHTPGNAPYTTPDNPYTAAVEGAGGDPMDISWAIDATGKHVNLDCIHFIKIYTAINESLGMMGEASSEITGIAATIPNPTITGEMRMVVIENETREAMAGKAILQNALAFNAGILTPNEKIEWVTTTPDLINIDAKGLIAFTKAGDATAIAKLSNYQTVLAKHTIAVLAPKRIDISIASKTLKEGESMPISAQVIDKKGEPTPNIPITFITSNSSIATASQSKLIAYTTGKCWLIAYLTLAPSYRDSVEIAVEPISSPTNVYFSIATATQSLSRPRPVSVKRCNLAEFTANSSNSLTSLSSIENITAAHAIAAAITQGSSPAMAIDPNNPTAGIYLSAIASPKVGTILEGFGTTAKPAWILDINGKAYLSGLETIAIKNGDNIIATYIENPLEAWSNISITAQPETTPTGQPVTITAKQHSYNPQEGKYPLEATATIPFAQPVYANQVPMQWNGSPVAINEQGIATLLFTQPGEKSIEVGNGATQVTITPQTGIAKASPSAINIWPQPCSTTLQISIEDEVVKTIMLYDMTGVLLRQITIEKNIDTTSIPSGLYLLQVSTNKQTYTTRVVIEH